MRIIVTGAGGFLAQNLIKELSKNKQFVIKAFLKKKVKTYKNSNIKYFIKKIENIKKNDLKGFDAVFNFASTGARNFYKNKNFFEDFEKTYHTNVIHSLNLFNNAIEVGIKRFVVAGSCFEYGYVGSKNKKLSINSILLPKGYYSISKASLFYHLKNLSKIHRQVNFIYLRYFQVYGDGEKLPRLWPQLKYNAKNNLDFVVETGSVVRDFISVQSVSQKTVEIFNKYKKKGLVVRNIGTGKGTTIASFAKIWWKKFNAKKKLIIKNKKTQHIKYLVSKNK